MAQSQASQVIKEIHFHNLPRGAADANGKIVNESFRFYLFDGPVFMSNTASRTSLKLNFLDKYIHMSYKCTNARNLTQYAILFDNSIILA